MAADRFKLSVTDVYETTASVGSEFQRFVDLYGSESIEKLMPAVLKALEQLESLAIAAEETDGEVKDLKLERDIAKRELAEEKQKQRQKEADMASVIDSLEREIATLQDKRTKASTAETTSGARNAAETATTVLEGEEEDAALRTMTERFAAKSDEVKYKERELAKKDDDIAALNQQIKRLATVNEDLRKNVALYRAKYDSMAEAKTTVEFQLEVTRQTVTQLEKRIEEQDEALAETNKSEKDDDVSEKEKVTEPVRPRTMRENSLEPRYSLEDLRTVLKQRNDWQTKAYALKDELEAIKIKFNIDWPSDEEEDDETGMVSRHLEAKGTSSSKKKSGVSPKAVAAPQPVEVLEMSEIHHKGKTEVDGGRKLSGVKQILSELPSFGTEDKNN